MGNTAIMTAEQAAEAARGLTFEKVWAALMESRELQAETARLQKETFARIEKNFEKVDESLAKTNATVDRVDKQVGELSGSIGRVIEEMFAAKLWEKFDGIYKFAHGEPLKIKDKDKNILAEVDMFLESDDCAMAVEIKTTLKTDDIDYHLERMEIVRRYMDERNDKRKLVGAVAGAVVHHSVRTYAHRNGLYVLEQSGESVVLVDSPHGFTAAEW